MNLTIKLPPEELFILDRRVQNRFKGIVHNPNYRKRFLPHHSIPQDTLVVFTFKCPYSSTLYSLSNLPLSLLIKSFSLDSTSVRTISPAPWKQYKILNHNLTAPCFLTTHCLQHAVDCALTRFLKDQTRAKQQRYIKIGILGGRWGTVVWIPYFWVPSGPIRCILEGTNEMAYANKQSM